MRPRHGRSSRAAARTGTPRSREFGGGGGAGGLPSAARNATVEELSKILSASQLSPANRSFYLSLRAFVFSRHGPRGRQPEGRGRDGPDQPAGLAGDDVDAPCPTLAGGGDRGAALRSLGYGLERKPNDPWLLIAQAQVQMQIADFRQRARRPLDGAVAGAASPIERRPAFYFRGHANLDLGNYAQAAGDFDAALEGQTTLRGRLGAVLWRYAAQVRGRQDARGGARSADIGNENLYEWPGPVAKFLIGRLPAGELEVAAEIRRRRQEEQRQVHRRLLHRHGRRAPQRQAARARAAPARPGALPDGVGVQLGGSNELKRL